MEKSKEVQLLDVIKNYLEKNLPNQSGLAVGLGEDCAALKMHNQNLIWSQDLLLEGTHFELDYFGPHDLGYKALAVNLSDLASQGAKPLGFMISLGLPSHLANKEWLLQFYEGLAFLAKKHQMFCAGGDLTYSKTQLVIDISILGEVSAQQQLWSRKNLRAGDLLAITGFSGLAHLGWKSLQNKNTASFAAVNRHLKPEPRTLLMAELRHHNLINTVIDTSDSLGTSAFHLARSSGLSIKLSANKIPLHPEIQNQQNSLEIALWGAEDYEVMLGFAPANRAALEKFMAQHHVPFHVIGEAQTKIEHSEVLLVGADGRLQNLTSPQDWSHF